MEDRKTSIKLRCLFCKSDQFIFPCEDYEPKPGDLITCASCGKQNDHDSLMRVMKRHAEDWTREQADQIVKEAAQELNKEFKKLFR